MITGFRALFASVFLVVVASVVGCGVGEEGAADDAGSGAAGTMSGVDEVLPVGREWFDRDGVWLHRTGGYETVAANYPCVNLDDERQVAALCARVADADRWDRPVLADEPPIPGLRRTTELDIAAFNLQHVLSSRRHDEAMTAFLSASRAQSDAARALAGKFLLWLPDTRARQRAIEMLVDDGDEVRSDMFEECRRFLSDESGIEMLADVPEAWGMAREEAVAAARRHSREIAETLRAVRDDDPWAAAQLEWLDGVDRDR